MNEKDGNHRTKRRRFNHALLLLILTALFLIPFTGTAWADEEPDLPSKSLTLEDAKEALLKLENFNRLKVEGKGEYYVTINREFPAEILLDVELQKEYNDAFIDMSPTSDPNDGFRFNISPSGYISMTHRGNPVNITRLWAYMNEMTRIVFTKEKNQVEIFRNFELLTKIKDPEPNKVNRIFIGGRKGSIILDKLKVLSVDRKTTYFEDNFNNGISENLSVQGGEMSLIPLDGLDYLYANEIVKYRSDAELVVKNLTDRKVMDFASQCQSQTARTLIYYSLAEKLAGEGKPGLAAEAAGRIHHPQERCAALCLSAQAFLKKGDGKSASLPLDKIPAIVKQMPHGSQKSFWLTRAGDIYAGFNRKRAADFYARAAGDGREYIKKNSYDRFFGYRAFMEQVIKLKWDTYTIPMAKLLQLDFHRGMSILKKTPLILPPEETAFLYKSAKKGLTRPQQVALFRFFLSGKYTRWLYSSIIDYYFYFMKIDRELTIEALRREKNYWVRDYTLSILTDKSLPGNMREAEYLTSLMTPSGLRDESYAKIAGLKGMKNYGRGIDYARRHIRSLRGQSIVMSYLIKRISAKDPQRALKLAKEIPDMDIRDMTVFDIKNPGKK